MEEKKAKEIHIATSGKSYKNQRNNPCKNMKTHEHLKRGWYMENVTQSKNY